MIRKRVRSYKVGQQYNVDNWRNALLDVPAFLLGNSPSIDDYDLSVLKNSFTVGINRIFYRFDPTILIWQDSELWYNHRSDIERLKAIKYCRHYADPANRYYHFKLNNGDYRLPDSPTKLYGRGSTGPLAFQLAFLLGCNPIILVGMDCKCRNNKTDFYGNNPFHNPHTMNNCSKGLKWIKKSKSNRQIYSTSSNDVFENYISLEEAVNKFRPPNPLNQSKLRKMILSAN